MNPACLLDSLLTPKCSFLKVYSLGRLNVVITVYIIQMSKKSSVIEPPFQLSNFQVRSSKCSSSFYYFVQLKISVNEIVYTKAMLVGATAPKLI